MINKPMSIAECDAVYEEALAYAETIAHEPLQTAVGLLMTQFNMDNASAAAIMMIIAAKPRPSGDPRYDVCMEGEDLILVVKHSGKRVRLTPHDLEKLCGEAPLISQEAVQKILADNAMRTK